MPDVGGRELPGHLRLMALRAVSGCVVGLGFGGLNCSGYSFSPGLAGFSWTQPEPPTVPEALCLGLSRVLFVNISLQDFL